MIAHHRVPIPRGMIFRLRMRLTKHANKSEFRRASNRRYFSACLQVKMLKRKAMERYL